MTVTVMDATADPAPFVAVSVYVVVAVGLTATDEPVTVPTPGLILRLLAPVTFHDSVLEVPAVIEAGSAPKLVMPGRDELPD